MSLHSLLLGPGEHALYAGGADGRIFEVPLAGQPVASLGAAPDLAGDGELHNRRWAVLEGHSRTVTCLEATTDGGYMLSGGWLEGFLLACTAQCTCVPRPCYLFDCVRPSGGSLLAARAITRGGEAQQPSSKDLGNKNLTGRSVLAFSGSEDGTVRVWELRSRQPLRVIAVADRAPVTGLLVLDRPPLLAAGQGRRQGASPSPAADPRGAAYLHAVAYAQQGSS